MCVRDPASGFRIAPHWPYIGKRTMASQFFDMTSLANFCDVLFLLSSSVIVNIMTGSGVMKNFFYKGLTGNAETRKNPIWVLPNIWRLGRVSDTKFSMNASNKVLLNAIKCQDDSFYRFLVIKGKPTRDGGQNYPYFPPLPRLGLKEWYSLEQHRAT